MRSVASSLLAGILVASACGGGPPAPAATGTAPAKVFQGTKTFTVAFPPIGASSVPLLAADVADLSYLQAIVSELGRK